MLKVYFTVYYINFLTFLHHLVLVLVRPKGIIVRVHTVLGNRLTAVLKEIKLNVTKIFYSNIKCDSVVHALS